MMNVHIGVLGAARILPSALLSPSQRVPEVTIAAIAARDPEKARKYATRHHIPQVFDSYADLLAEPSIDAVYIPLPISLHAPWTIKALEAGKHVLCEKPFAANADEALLMASAAETSGRVLMEGFHYRYHPLAARMRAIVASGELGAIRRVESWMCIPLPIPSDIRYNFTLAGGATMDTGSYAVDVLRFLLGTEPEVISATARLASPQVDRCMTAELRFPSGITGRMTCSLFSSMLFRISVRVTGERGRLDLFNFVAPQYYHRVTVRTVDGTRHERISGEATYTYQLRAFYQAIATSTPTLSDPENAVHNMRVIDDIYRHAGLQLRGK
jgi:predicted dehydrogenase